MEKSVKIEPIVDLATKILTNDNSQAHKDAKKIIQNFFDNYYSDLTADQRIFYSSISGSNRYYVETAGRKKEYECEILIKYEFNDNDSLYLIKDNSYRAPIESDKLIDILNRKEILKKMGGLKVLIEGRPGTGKTTYIKYLAFKANKELYILNAANLVSQYLGETQKNITKLKKDILAIKKNSIILIDELDSIIGNRKEDINGEYKRMIGDFSIMLDELPSDSTIFATTNTSSLIDQSTLRRFNVKIYLDSVDLDYFIELLMQKFSDQNEEVIIKRIISKILHSNYNSEELINFSMIDQIYSDYVLFNTNPYFSLLEKINVNTDDQNQLARTLHG